MARSGDWPTTRSRDADPITHGRKVLTAATPRERDAFDGLYEKGSWWKKRRDGYYLTFRVDRTIIVLDKATGSKCYICETKEEAKERYDEKLREIEQGVFDELIKAIPPRKRRT